MFEDNDLEELLEDIEDSMSQPEATHVFELIMRRNFEEAAEILSEYIEDSDETNALIQYLFKKHNTNVTLVEINPDSIDRSAFETDDSGYTYLGRFLYRYRSEIKKTELELRHGQNVGDALIYRSGNNITLADVDQLWQIIEL